MFSILNVSNFIELVDEKKKIDYIQFFYQIYHRFLLQENILQHCHIHMIHTHV